MPSRPASWWATSTRSRPPAGCSWSQSGKDEKLELSARNLPGVTIIRADSLNVVDVLNADMLLITQPSLGDDGGGVRMTLQASQIVLRPVISEKSMDETQRDKYTFAVHDDANKLQIKAAVEELFKVTRAGRQRPHHQAQGEEPQPQARPRQGLDLALEEGRRDRRGQRQDRILRGGLGDAAAKLQADLPGRRFMTRSTFEEITTDKPHKPLLEPRSAAAAATTRAA